MGTTLTTASTKKTRNRARLRILATTDLHGHLMPHDYIKDQPTQGGGLVGLAKLIAQARTQATSENTPVLLLDNGDTFQGTALASHLAEQTVSTDHPIVACLNHLKYDAVGLGNHDLDHGLPYLKAVAQALHMPILNSNLRDIDLTPLKSSLLITIDLGEDAPAPLTVGIVSVLPSESAAWHSHHLGPSATLADPALTVALQSQKLRRDGADLIVVLAHMGVGQLDKSATGVRAAQTLAHSRHVDALILGHTHRRMPSDDYAGRNGVDIHNSTLSSVPTVMAGHAGSDLAVMDLELSHDDNHGWRVHQHKCSLRPNSGDVMPDADICALSDRQHRSVRAYLKQPVATAPHDIHSYFSLVCPSQTQHLTARALYTLIRDMLAGTPEADLPLLASAAAHGAGGRDGLGNFVHIPKGAVLRRHIAGMIPFANSSVVIRITGAQLHGWLEHAALVFNTLKHNTPDQMLVSEEVPAFQFDTIFGLHYQINPAAPPYARISQIMYDGAEVRAEQEFALATTQFRVAGGGGYLPTPATRIIATSNVPLQDGLISALKNPQSNPWAEAPAWRFASMSGIQAILLSHPDASGYTSEIQHLDPKSVGNSKAGFIQLRVTL